MRMKGWIIGRKRCLQGPREGEKEMQKDADKDGIKND